MGRYAHRGGRDEGDIEYASLAEKGNAKPRAQANHSDQVVGAPLLRKQF
jgi:hypothetical protein